MAAIKPHLAQDETSDLEERYWGCSKDSSKGLGDVDLLCPTPSEVIDQSHAELMTVAYTRKIIAEQLAGRTITPTYRGGEIVLTIDQPIAGPNWNPMPGGIKNTGMLSWTTKMGTPSFSLPAGASEMGGSCPGAAAGQSIVSDDDRRKAARILLPVLKDVAQINMAKTTCEFCLAGDTRVMVLGRGLMRLDELDPNEEIEVWSGEAWRTTRVVFRGIKPVVKLRDSWGHEVIATADHEMLIEGEKIAIEDLEGDETLTATAPDREPFPYVKETNLESFTPQARENAPNYPVQWSYELGAALGWLAGDGCLYNNTRYPSVHLAKGADSKETMTEVSKWINDWTGSAAELRQTDTGTYQIAWHSRSAVSLFVQLGLDKQPNSTERRVPSSIWTASRSGVIGFLAGVFATDGCVQIHKNRVTVSVSQISHGFLRDVQSLLSAFDIRSNICEYKDNAERGYKNLYKLEVSADSHVRRFAETIGFCHSSKQQKLEEAVRAVAPKEARRRSPVVRSIEKLNSEIPVFDLINVGDEHVFWANGLIVSNCYAEGGQYGSASVQYHQMVRYAWTRRAITEDLNGHKLKDGPGSKDSAFVQIMIDAINRTDFELSHEPAHWAGKRFFRLHDSGDFFSISYLKAWKHVADHFHPSRHQVPIVFWAPTRIWALGERIVNVVNEINGEGDSNLVIRPSAYHIDQHGPEGLGRGWASPSVTYTHDGKAEAEGKTFDWDCKAYQTKDSPNCRGAQNPDGKIGCRACWMRPDLRVNYTLH